MKTLPPETIHSTLSGISVAPRELPRQKTDAGKRSLRIRTVVISWLKSLALLVIGGALVLGSASSASAGPMHARATIGLGIHSQLAPHGGVAHAERRQGSKYRVAHEQFGNNYTYGNAGSGHADHHAGLFRSSPGEEQNDSNRRGPEITPPLRGSRGTSQYIKQTWLPTRGGGEVTVSWTPESFLQVDPSEITSDGRVVSRAKMTAAGGLTGTVELWGQRDKGKKPQFNTRLTGIFKGIKFELVTHPNGVVSLRFRQPLTWTVRGDSEDFGIALDASIENTTRPNTDSISILSVPSGVRTTLAKSAVAASRPSISVME